MSDDNPSSLVGGFSELLDSLEAYALAVERGEPLPPIRAGHLVTTRLDVVEADGSPAVSFEPGSGGSPARVTFRGASGEALAEIAFSASLQGERQSRAVLRIGPADGTRFELVHEEAAGAVETGLRLADGKTERMFLGIRPDGAAELEMRDAAGEVRLLVRVEAGGKTTTAGIRP